MRTLHFAVLALVCLLPVRHYAQSGLEIGIFALPQSYRLFNDDDINFFTYEAAPITLNSYGAFIAVNSKRKIGFYTGFISTQQGQRYLGGASELLLNQTISNLQEIRLSYFKIPLFLQFRSNRYQARDIGGRKVGLALQFGPQINLLQKVEWLDFEDNEIEITDSQGETINKKDAYKNQTLSLGMAVGLNIAITRKISANCQLRMDYSLDDMENKSFAPGGDDFYNPRRLTTTGASFALQTGLSFLISND